MKVETTGTKQFKPIELVITIESKEELEAIINMCGYNESIPDLVGKDNSNFITLFLDETRDALKKRV
jgi:hypothetical protein